MTTPRNNITIAATTLLAIALGLGHTRCAAQPAQLASTKECTELLALAFSIASTIPPNPHERDRARMQELVVQACIELGELDLATTNANAISGWRRGEAIALIGQQYAKNHDVARAHAFAEKALLVAAGESEWRRERITIEASKIAVQLGEESEALTLAAAASPAQRGQVQVAHAARALPETFDAHADEFDRAIATKNFDLARGAIDGYLALLTRVAADDARSARACTSIEGAIPGLPLDLQVTYTVDFARVLSANGQKDRAIAQMKRSAELFAATKFLAEDVAPLGCSIARARIEMGDVETARAELHALRAQFDARRSEIVDLRRARSLRSLAEAFEEVGDRESAMACYAAAVEEGCMNPNARPRAEDLCATCISLALARVIPTPGVRTRIDLARVALVDPW